MTTTTRDQAITDGATAIKAAWQDRFKESINDGTLLIILAQIFMESQFGRAIQGYAPIFWGTNNYGAIQAIASWCSAHKNDPGYGYILTGDVHADGTAYVYPYQVLPTQIASAESYLHFVFEVKGVNKHAVFTPAFYALALKHVGYYEATVEHYIQMINNGIELIQHALSLNLTPSDVTKPTGDDFPPNAFDGKHLPMRVTLFGESPPDHHSFNLKTVLGYQGALKYLASIDPVLSDINPGPVDGIDGPQTKSAVKEFQRLTDCLIDGIVGPQTQTAIYKALEHIDSKVLAAETVSEERIADSSNSEGATSST